MKWLVDANSETPVNHIWEKTWQEFYDSPGYEYWLPICGCDDVGCDESELEQDGEASCCAVCAHLLMEEYDGCIDVIRELQDNTLVLNDVANNLYLEWKALQQNIIGKEVYVYKVDGRPADKHETEVREYALYGDDNRYEDVDVLTASFFFDKSKEEELERMLLEAIEQLRA